MNVVKKSMAPSELGMARLERTVNRARRVVSVVVVFVDGFGVRSTVVRRDEKCRVFVVGFPKNPLSTNSQAEVSQRLFLAVLRFTGRNRRSTRRRFQSSRRSDRRRKEGAEVEVAGDGVGRSSG